jgi:gentisate 1,2-dioxygenase
MAENNIKLSDASARAQLAGKLAKFNIRVHQADDPPLFTPEPQSSMQPLHWRAADLAELLEDIGRNLALEPGGQRRTLRLANPGLAYGTTPTFWGSIQYILPGEVATAHRHTANALRFIMDGDGAFTTVEGEQYPMRKGDLVLTPSLTWHDHEHRGEKPMVWLDVLDVSLVRSLHATFFEGSPTPVQEVSKTPHRSFQKFGSGLMRPINAAHSIEAGSGVSSPLLVYPAAVSQEALSQAGQLPPDPYFDTILEYQNPLTGGPAMTTIGTQLQSLRPGFSGLDRRHTGSFLNYIVEGSGSTIVTGQRFDWGKGDFIAIPPWQWHRHINTGETSVVIFQVNDLPVMKSLGLYKEENKIHDA